MEIRNFQNENSLYKYCNYIIPFLITRDFNRGYFAKIAIIFAFDMLMFLITDYSD